MGALRQRELFLTVADYLSLESGSDVKHEYFDGQIYAMAGATLRHNRLVAAVVSSLHQQLRGKTCDVISSDQRILIEATGLRTYPDVVVACSPHQFSADDPLALIDATVIIEILSPSTASYDRTTKFDNYQHLPSLRHYILVEQNRVEVEHYHWQSGVWKSEQLTSLDDEISLDVIGCTLKLGDIYEGIKF